MLDMVVLVAMAVTAAAFAAGLVVQAGLPLFLALIAAAALYLTMAASYVVVARTSRSTPDNFRLDEIEGVLENIGSDLQRIDRVEGGHARIEELAAELGNVHERIEGLRADLEVETRSQREKISYDLGMLEGLIKQLSQDLAAPGAAVAAAAASNLAAPEPPRVPEPAEEEPVADIRGEDVTLSDEEIESVVAAVAEIMEGGESLEVVETETVYTITEVAETAPRPDVPEAAGPEAAAVSRGDGGSQDGMLDILHQAIEAGRVDLYFQPIVTLPGRKIRYYEGLTRMRNAADEVILPGAYLPVAEGAGLMPVLDNVLLVKSVQALRTRSPESKLKGVFCNVSMQSLLDSEFFAELVEFLEQNISLSENLFFEVHQAEIMGLTRAELGSLDTLGALGFNFSLNHISDLDIDYIGLSDRYFRFLKIDAPTFLHHMQEKGAPLPPDEMVRYLEGFGLQVIVEKVQDENSVRRLVDLGAELAQGNLFGKAKPMSPSLFRELEDADAA